MNATSKTTNQPTREQIANQAYQLWEQHGRQPGRDQDFWFQAERQLLAAQALTAATTARPAANTAAILGGNRNARRPRSQAH